VIRNAENLGFAAGVNIGIRATSRPFVLLLNPDTEVKPGAIAALVNHARQYPEVGIAGPRVVNLDGSLQSSRFRFPSLLDLVLSATYLYQLLPNSSWLNRQRFGNQEVSAPVASEAVSGCCFLVRRTVLEQVGLLDEDFFMYAEETDLCLRASRAGWRVDYVPAAVIVHEGGGSSRLARRRNFLEFRRSILRFFLKHRGRGAAEVARLLLLLFLIVRLPYWASRSLLPGNGRAEGAAHFRNVLAGISFLLAPLPRLLARPVPPGPANSAPGRGESADARLFE
jgi:GT2 family glycosyltransferase